MLILGIDTSGKNGGVTLAEAAAQNFRVLGSNAIAGGTFSAQLVPTVAALLEKNEFGIRAVDGFAVASGPGSFTGLRVGLSAIKGLAEVLQKPIVTVSILEALAALSPANGTVMAVLDAGRTEVFLGLNKVADGIAEIIGEQLLSRQDLLQRISQQEVAAVVTSDAALAEAVSGIGARVELVERPDSSVVARIGARKLLAGERIAVEALDANYLRRSDAEIFFKGNR